MSAKHFKCDLFHFRDLFKIRYNSLRCVIVFVVRKQLLWHYFNELSIFVVYRESTYYLADAKEVEARKFVKQGSESIKTDYGTFDTIKVVMKHDKPGRETIFWLAPKLDYLPVKVSHVDKKTSYGLLLTGYKGTSN